MTKKTPPELQKRYRKADLIAYPSIVLSILVLIFSSSTPGDTTIAVWGAGVILALGISVLARSFSFKSEYEMAERLKRIETKLDKLSDNNHIPL